MNSLKISLLFFGSIFVLSICPFFGMNVITPFDLSHNPLQSNIFFSLRLPRAFTAFLAGGGLSLCGMVYQAMFRNPLAEPFTLGVASGASCGAALTILFGLDATLFGISGIAVGAFSGAFIAIFFVYGFSRLSKKTDSFTMLLAGIAISFMFSSILMFCEYLSDMHDSFQIVRWLMGGLEVFGYESVVIMLIFIGLGTIIIAWKLPELDHLLTGEDMAKSRGVSVAKTKAYLLFATTLIIGITVANCGPIGFVGLIIPYFARRYFILNHRVLGPASFLMGGMFLLIADTFSRIIIAPTEIPVGVITALLGAPFFLWILLSHKKQRHINIF
jgi:ABC-type Fe3+-siderophore transport system, permease component